METELNTLLDNIRADYYEYTRRGRNAADMSDTNRKMIAEFNNSLKIVAGKKYIKIIQENRVWGFIMAEDDDKFKKGDILKAAGWNAPAKNKARGNILNATYAIQWTGPYYL